MKLDEMNEAQAEQFKLFKKAVRESDINTVREVASAFPEIIHMTTSPFPPWVNAAAKRDSVQVLETLVQMGADPSLHTKTYENENALTTAASAGLPKNVEFLIAAGVEIETETAISNPLFASVTGKNAEVVQMLLNAGLNARLEYPIRPNQRYGALEFALERGERKIASVIALHLAGGDAAGAQAELDRAWAVVRAVFEGQEGENPPPPKIVPPYQ